MKKTIGLIALLFICGILGSCAPPSPPDTEKAPVIAYSRDRFTETPTRILYTTSGEYLYYYNKLTETSHVFCFDPLCNHISWETCIAHKFFQNGINVTVQYYEPQNRFYTFRGQKFCSFSFDGSDLVIEYSLGEHGDFDDWTYNPFCTMSLQLWGSRAYFITLDSETGNRELCYIDLETKKMTVLTDDIADRILGYQIFGDKIYLMIVGETMSGVYRADADLLRIEKISEDSRYLYSDAPFLNGYYYFVESELRETETGEKSVPVGLSCASLEDGTLTRLYTLTDSVLHDILAVSEEYIYFIKKEPRSIGYRQLPQGVKVEMQNSFSRIYRFNRSNKECEVIFEDLSCEVDSFYFIDDTHVMILGKHCVSGEGNADKTSVMWIATTDERGYFKDPRITEVAS